MDDHRHTQGRTPRARFVMFTLFSPPNIVTESQYATVTYYVYQKEIAPTTGREHWQGYIEFESPVRFATMKKHVFGDDTVHLEPRMGSQEDAIEYCMKEETRAPGEQPVVWGTPYNRHQGKRSDIDRMTDDIKAGKPMKRIRAEHSTAYAHAHVFANQMFMDIAEEQIPAFRTLTVYVIWGITGYGKTRRCYAFDPELYKLDHAGGTIWFDGYCGQKTLLIDDFYGTIPIGFMLNLLDGYPMRLPVKGSFVKAAWTTVLITSNKNPDEWYQTCAVLPEHGFSSRLITELSAEQKNALHRRITKIIHVSTEWKPGDPIFDIQ